MKAKSNTAKASKAKKSTTAKSKKRYVFVIGPQYFDHDKNGNPISRWIIKLARTQDENSRYEYKVYNEEKAIHLAGKIALDQNVEIKTISTLEN
jgi:hypothetical protein